MAHLQDRCALQVGKNRGDRSCGAVETAQADSFHLTVEDAGDRTGGSGSGHATSHGIARGQLRATCLGVGWPYCPVT